MDMRIVEAQDGDPRGTGDAVKLSFAQMSRSYRRLAFGGVWMGVMGSVRQIGSRHVLAEFALKNIDVFVVSLLPRRWRFSIAFMGHSPSRLGGKPLTRVARLVLLSRADWFFAYTPQEAAKVAASGFDEDRISNVANTIDTRSLVDDLARVTASDLDSYAQTHDLTRGKVALFLGTVDEAKDIDFVLAVAQDLWVDDQEFRVLVAGSGKSSARVAELSEVMPGLRHIGRVDGLDKALALSASDILLCPRGVGLVAVDALVASVPIVTIEGNGHGPEVDYLDKSSALLLPPGTSHVAFGAAVSSLLSDRERLESMKVSGQVTAASLTLGGMSSSLTEGILKWMDRWSR